MIKTILSQTLADAGKPIPSSTILFGGTGSGKTFMFVSLVKMLGLQLYDFTSGADNTNASAIIINVGRAIEDSGKAVEDKGKNDNSDLTSIKIIEHLNNFLSLPNGYRGWILIDDVHAASDKVKAEVLSWLRGTFESPGGMYTAKKTGSRRPIRNLNIFMTLNPASDQEQIGRFAKDKSKPTTEELLLATLSTTDFKVEPSFLRRWNSIINLDYMPVGAKGPELIKSLAEASKNLLNSHSRIALVDPSIVRRLVMDNEKLDARSFLSSSTSSLIDMAGQSETKGSVGLIVPSKNNLRGAYPLPTFGIEGNATERIDGWVKNNTRILSLDSGIDGNLALMQLLLNAFRIPIYEVLIAAIQEDQRFSGDVNNQRTLLAPILAAISDHLSQHSELPIYEIGLRPSQFGIKTQGERDSFNQSIKTISNSIESKNYFPINFGKLNSSAQWQELFNSTDNNSDDSSINHLIVESISQNKKTVDQHLKTILNLQDLEVLPDTFKWLMNLTLTDPKSVKRVGRELADNLWTFLPLFFAENLNSKGSASGISVYGATRLFLYSIDRSITQLPWISTNLLVLQALELITQDQVLSQKSGVQNFLFSDRYRLLKPTITDLAFQMIANSPVVESIPAKSREQWRLKFSSDCESLLTPNNEL